MTKRYILFMFLSFLSTLGYILIMATTHYRLTVLALAPIYALGTYGLCYGLVNIGRGKGTRSGRTL